MARLGWHCLPRPFSLTSPTTPFYLHYTTYHRPSAATCLLPSVLLPQHPSVIYPPTSPSGIVTQVCIKCLPFVKTRRVSRPRRLRDLRFKTEQVAPCLSSSSSSSPRSPSPRAHTQIRTAKTHDVSLPLQPYFPPVRLSTTLDPLRQRPASFVLRCFGVLSLSSNPLLRRGTC